MSIEDKQNYLRENILEKGYNGNEFMTFLQEKKGEEIILDDWSLEELKSTVYEFIEIKKKEIESDNKNNINQVNENKEEDIKKEDQKEEDIIVKEEQIQKAIDSIISEEKDTINCNKVEKTPFSEGENSKISLSFPEKIEGGLFSKSYVTYLVEASPLGTKTRKRYTDFEWLRQIMSSFYLGSVIPPLPKKNFSGRFNENFISKRMRGLEKFMNGLVIDPLMKTSPMLNDFVSIENEADWNLKKKEYNKQKIPNVITELYSLTGEVPVSFTSQKEMYFINIKDNVNQNLQLFKTLIANLKLLVNSMNNTSRIMAEISEIWKLLYENSQKYFEDKQTINSYNILCKFMQNWSESQRRHADLINVDLKEYFRYLKNELIATHDLIARVDYNQNVFKKADDRLNSKKEDLFNKKDITKWEIAEKDSDKVQQFLNDKNIAFKKMLPRDTNNVINLKYTYGFYLNRMIDEYERIRLLNGVRHKQFVNSFCKKNTDILTDLHVSVADLIAYYSESEMNN